MGVIVCDCMFLYYDLDDLEIIHVNDLIRTKCVDICRNI